MGTDKHRTVIYARVSDDQDGRSRSVEQQLDQCRQWCDGQGWPVVAELTDVDISASRYSRKARPGWATVVELIEAGEVDALVAWDLDRLLRQPKELELLIDLAERNELMVQTLGAGDIDLSKIDGRAMARVLVAFAAKESETLSRRTKRAKAAKAHAGEPPRMTGVVPFGWADGMTPDPDESAVLVDGMDRLLSGAISVTRLAWEWTEAGYRTARGARKWSTTTIRNVMTNPKHAGLAVHRGVVVGEGQWPAIIDLAKHEQIKAHFDVLGARYESHPRRVAPFTRLVRCGKCGHLMINSSKSGGRRIYVCKRTPNDPTRCGSLGIMAEPLDQLMIATVFDLVDRGSTPEPEPVVVAVADPAAVAEHERLTRLINELADDLVDGRIDRAVYLATAEKLTAKRDAVPLPEPPAPRATAADKYLGQAGALAAAWPDLDDDERNRILSALIERITVLPVGKGYRVPPEERIDVVWKV